VARHRTRDVRWRIVATRTALRTDEGRNLTDHATPHSHDGGLFRTPEQADGQEVVSGVEDVKPVARPSRDLFHQAGGPDAAEEHRHPAAQRDAAVMRSLQFPFHDGDCG
jgi:hypothetical protein